MASMKNGRNNKNGMMVVSIAVVLMAVLSSVGSAFLVGSLSSSSHLSFARQNCCNFSPQRTLLLSALNEDVVDLLSPPELQVYNFLQEVHNSQKEFRIVVVGNGAILETTTVLGDVTKLSKSPQTGEALMTLASKDQSFEFHVKLAQVSKISLTEKQSPQSGKIMRVMRFLTDTGTPMCSLICNDEGAAEWFQGMVDKHGTEMQL